MGDDPCTDLRRYYDEVAEWNAREHRRVEAVMAPLHEALLRMAIQLFSTPVTPSHVWMSWEQAQRFRFPRRRTRKNPARTTWGQQRA